ncbi:ketopantoate reductase family protein [Marinobacter sp. JB05H06]|nr:ketopantoate reductase family protein [Marinobacter sp. JB05H06]
MVGAGGVGGYYAARLLQAGHKVVLTARGEHLKAIREKGLTVRYEGETINLRAEALDHQTLITGYLPDDFDVIVIALKSTVTGAVLEELGSWLRRGQVNVLSLQNGVDNEPLLAQAVGDKRVIGGLAVRIGGHIAEPGVIEAEGAAQVVMGGWPMSAAADDARTELLQRLASEFNAAGIPTRLSENIRYELWRKLVINNGVNPLSAVTGLDTKTLTHHPKFRKIVHGMMAETVEASKADGVNLGPEDLEEMFELISNFNAIKTSMLVDKEKGRPLELDSIAGAVLRRCERLGVEAPYTETVHALLLHSVE